MNELLKIIVEVLTIAGMLWPIVRRASGAIFKLNLILKEVTPNGGNSLKDRVIALEEATKNQDEKLDDQTKRLHRIEEKLNEGKTRDDARSDRDDRDERKYHEHD